MNVCKTEIGVLSYNPKYVQMFKEIPMLFNTIASIDAWVQGKRVPETGVRVWCQFYLPFIASKFMNTLITTYRLGVMQQLVCGMHLANVVWITTLKQKSNHFNFNEIFIARVIGFYFECANCSEFPFHNLFGSIRIVWLTFQALWSELWPLINQFNYLFTIIFFCYHRIVLDHIQSWTYSVFYSVWFCSSKILPFNLEGKQILSGLVSILWIMSIEMKMVGSQSTFSIQSHPFNAIRHSWAVYGSVDLYLKFEKKTNFHSITPLN